jgi:hypothetical protein
MRVHDRDKSGRVELRESSVFDGQSDAVRCYSRAGQNDPKVTSKWAEPDDLFALKPCLPLNHLFAGAHVSCVLASL